MNFWFHIFHFHFTQNCSFSVLLIREGSADMLNMHYFSFRGWLFFSGISSPRLGTLKCYSLKAIKVKCKHDKNYSYVFYLRKTVVIFLITLNSIEYIHYIELVLWDLRSKYRWFHIFLIFLKSMTRSDTGTNLSRRRINLMKADHHHRQRNDPSSLHPGKKLHPHDDPSSAPLLRPQNWTISSPALSFQGHLPNFSCAPSQPSLHLHLHLHPPPCQACWRWKLKPEEEEEEKKEGPHLEHAVPSFFFFINHQQIQK